MSRSEDTRLCHRAAQRRAARAGSAAALAAFAVATALACGTSEPGDDARTSPASAGAADRSGSDTALADTLAGLIERAYDFSEPDVQERMGALYADAGAVVSATGGRITTSADSVRASIASFWEQAGRNMRDARWEWGAVHVQRLGPDAAVLTATWTIPHIAPAGNEHVLGGAWTAVFRRIDGDWRIVHEHLSEPVS